MDFKRLRKELERSTNVYTTIESAHKRHVEQEVEVLESLLAFLMPSLPQETINGKKAVLIYVYEDSSKKTISNKVFYCEDGKIRYQVFKKDEYMNYNPTVEYDGSYAVVEAAEHFSKRNGLELSDVVDFFVERVDALKEIAAQLDEGLELRKQYLESFKKIARDFL
ncbi:hypothetical protein CON36_19595 [Bacillus cereus]|uniref:Uncharacterized protein n=2 Tax=Bacillus cereus group TaxID=86661 RepID=A0A9X6ZQ93_BACTU|nr:MULTISPECIES: hypothetical protein [Bacillus cereus group]PDZ97073.1 hypothetical protein CON36_19595 [Bacillus cereus]PFJ29390.1 hypothetical protein COJ15_31875 [Bacillus thuringiensis]PGP12556.1 hypothetical protein COA01_32590 [Bacillus cereus]